MVLHGRVFFCQRIQNYPSVALLSYRGQRDENRFKKIAWATKTWVMIHLTAEGTEKKEKQEGLGNDGITAQGPVIEEKWIL